ncbi:MAG: RagB/SusD family nutrient uptake outer membrane protein [Bacteroides sp.]
MRTLYTILSMALSIGIFTSCGNDWLDLEPSTQVPTETSIKSLSDIDYSLNAIYATMRNSNAYSGRLMYYGDVTGDDMQAVQSTCRTAHYYQMDWLPANGPSAHWSYLYTIIQNCNVILDGIKNISIHPEDEDEQTFSQDLEGQALAIRGLALFDLTRFFGYTYLKDNGASLGVTVITSAAASAENKPARNTVAECYAQIINDLKKAAGLMIPTYAWTGTNLNNKDLVLSKKGKIGKWATLTLLSRVYLYMGKNAEALQTAEEAIKGAEKNDYQLWTTEAYPTAWAADASASNPGEVLFEIVNTTTESPGNESMGYLNSQDGYQDMCITASFYHHLLKTPKDVRIKLLVNERKKVTYVNKYQPQAGENIRDANIPLMRLSETYLNAAEAALKTGAATKATTYLKKIALRGNPDYVVPEKLTLGDVLEERRKELIGEGHRMFDLLRNHLRVKRISETDPTMKEVAHFADEQSMDFDWSYYRTVLPIPQSEINANANMVQTPEYLK